MQTVIILQAHLIYTTCGTLRILIGVDELKIEKHWTNCNQQSPKLRYNFFQNISWLTAPQ